MIDKYVHKSAQIILKPIALGLNKCRVRADHITIVGSVFGLITIVFVYTGQYHIALWGLVLNRTLDGLDGALARLNGITLAGGFLDIILDFIFYAGFVAFFGLSQPAFLQPTMVLLLSFFGTGTSFLAFASVAAKYNIQSPQYPNKSLYYMGGITEGTETIIAFVLMLVFPRLFPPIAYIFSILCFLTTAMRILFGYKNLTKIEQENKAT